MARNIKSVHCGRRAWPEMDEAIGLLEKDRKRFLQTHFQEGADLRAKGTFSMRSL